MQPEARHSFGNPCVFLTGKTVCLDCIILIPVITNVKGKQVDAVCLGMLLLSGCLMKEILRKYLCGEAQRQKEAAILRG